MTTTANKMLQKLVEDFNDYSELVALNREQKQEGSCDEGMFQWNRGHLNCIDKYLRTIAEDMSLELIWECNEHNFECQGQERQLKYRTVRLPQ